MKRLLPLLLLAALGLYSCNGTDIQLNKDIDAGLRAQIKQKNDSLLIAMKTGSASIYQALGSDDFYKAIQSYTRNIPFLFRRGYVDTSYKVYDEFYVEGAQLFDAIQLQSGNKGYTFMYSSPAKDTYVSILEFDFGNEDTGAVSVTYGLIDGKWQLCDLDAFMLLHYGKTPLKLYDMAKEEEEASHILDAAYYANAAVQLLDQYDDTKFQYNDAKKIRLYATTIESRVDEAYKFPYFLEAISTKPALNNIFTEQKPDGLYYTIGYTTHVDLNDTPALTREYDKVRVEARKYLKGINFGKHPVKYKAMDVSWGGTYTSREFTDSGK